MFGISWTEMLLVGVVALIVIGPKDLPVVMGRIGKMAAQIRRLGNEFQRELNKTTGLDQITDLRRSITEPLKTVASDITRDFNKVTETGQTVPTGVIAPKDPSSESIVDEIHEKVGMMPPSVPVAPIVAAASSVESPAPAEAIAPAPPKPARKPRAPKPMPADGGPVVEASRRRRKVVVEEQRADAAVVAAPLKAAAARATETPAARKPAAPRKPRVTKPKSEA